MKLEYKLEFDPISKVDFTPELNMIDWLNKNPGFQYYKKYDNDIIPTGDEDFLKTVFIKTHEFNLLWENILTNPDAQYDELYQIYMGIMNNIRKTKFIKNNTGYYSKQHIAGIVIFDENNLSNFITFDKLYIILFYNNDVKYSWEFEERTLKNSVFINYVEQYKTGHDIEIEYQYNIRILADAICKYNLYYIQLKKYDNEYPIFCNKNNDEINFLIKLSKNNRFNFTKKNIFVDKLDELEFINKFRL